MPATKILKTTLLALTLAAGGCSTLEFKPLGTEALRNSQGHVIGYVERLCDCGKGEELDRVVLYTPRLGERQGRGLRGARQKAASSFVFVPRESEPLPAVQLARVTIEEIKQHFGITN